MTPERWQHIKTIFYGALERPPSERASFLDSACAGDEAARREVSQLVSAHEESGEFLNSPAFEVAARALADGKPEGLVQGHIISHYRVVKSLGAGGMGEVYLAQDAKLNRAVALKLLPAEFSAHRERLRRFEQEACAASALNHPNILTIYEIGDEGGRHFIAAEYIEGETLRQRIAQPALDLQEALDIAIQIASALAAAHKAKIVHRDVKPENVMIREDGLVKVLDFGLAKSRGKDLGGVADGAASTRPLVNTAPGTVLGTVAYMSPEQARGLEVDERTDVWSLGVVLYEMIAGKVPFAGASSNEIISAIISKERQAPLARFAHDVPERLEEIVAKALRKDREQRYQTARDLALDLKSLKEELEVEARLRRRLQPDAGGEESGARSDGSGVTGTIREPARTGHVVPARLTGSVEHLVGEIRRHKTFAAAALLILLVGPIGLTYFTTNRNRADAGARRKKSFAVLPLKPINAASRDEIYEIGVADSLIHRLSAVKGLIVRPLSATRKYADVGQDPLAAGREQQADYVLASNYQLAAGKIRITAQLFEVSSGQVEETYKVEKDAGDIFAVQDAVGEEVGKLLQARFAAPSSSPTAKRGTTNEEAYRLYLQAMYLVDKENPTDSKRAIELFDEALALDPNYAKAWANKARAHCHFAHTGGSSPDAEFAKAKPAIERAFALDPDLADAYAVLGIIKTDYDWDFAEGEKLFLRAIELAPNSDFFYRWYANRLAGQGRSDEAIVMAKTAIDLNPNYVVHQIFYGRTLYFARRYDDAIKHLERIVEVDSARSDIFNILWLSFHQKGDYARAYESFMRLQQLTGTKDETLKNHETLYAKSGWQGVLHEFLETLKVSDAKGSAAYNIAVLSALLGEREQSFRYLNDAVKNRSLAIPNIKGDPGLDSLRDDRRFGELVRRAGLQ